MIEYDNVKGGSKKERKRRRQDFFKKYNITETPTPHSTLSMWRKKKAIWIALNQKELRKHRNRSGKGRGRYHDCEKILYGYYQDRRARGIKVTHRWLRARMRQICIRLKPKGKSFENYKGFGYGWSRRFCKRWRISLQRKTTKKTVAVFQRLHKIQQYHRTLIYDLQDPRNFGEERNPQEKRNNWFSQAWYVDNHRDPTSGNEDDQENVGELIVAESEISENETL